MDVKQSIFSNLLTLIASTALSVVVVELLARLLFGAPVFAWRDWRAEKHGAVHTFAAYHPLLGWEQKAGIVGTIMNTIEHGIRKNSSLPEAIDAGAILAVGDSFTVGAEVNDDQTWPAHLERKTGLRVLNAGVSAYGVDQSTLNAERLLPIVRPKLVLVGILSDDILRARYRLHGAPKPYFAEHNGDWVLQNVPVPLEVPRTEGFGKTLLARSFTIHYAMMRNRDLRDYWFTGSGIDFDLAHNDGPGASCHALERLAKLLTAVGTKGIVVIQYGGESYTRKPPRPRHVLPVLACAQQYGFGIVDEFDALSAVARNSLDRLKTYYMMHARWSFGHMSPTGNALVGGLIAEHLVNAPGLTTGLARTASAAR